MQRSNQPRRGSRRAAKALVGIALAVAPFEAAAQESAEADVAFEASTDDLGGDDDSSAFLLAGKGGGIVPIAGFSPFITGAIELGWVFGGTGRSIAALLDVSYTAPNGDGTVDDARFASGSFDWDLTQKQLVLQPTFLYRFTGSSDFTPYLGIGPRFYFLETTVEGTSGDETIPLTNEQSFKFGGGIPIGVEYELGPGGLLAELLLQFAPIDHEITGETNLGAASLFLGYRALL